MNTRRHFLTGCAGGATLAAMFDRRRAAAAPAGLYPQRFLIFAHMNGQITNLWRPTGSEATFTFSDTLKALDPFKSKILVVDGLQSQTAMDARIDGHAAAMSGILTGRSDVPAQRGHPSNVQSASLSIDQFVADKLRGPARLRSIEVSLGINNQGNSPCINYPAGGGKSMPYLRDPEPLFDRLFSGAAVTGGVAPDAAELRRLRTRRASVIDQVAKDLSGVARHLGKEDRDKVAFHLTGIRDIEKQLTAPVAARPACGQQTKPKNLPNDKTLIPQVLKLQMDLIIQAFACDITRVATFANGDTSWNAPIPFLDGVNKAPHAISHNEGSPYKWDDVGPKLMRFNYEQMAYMLQGLASIREGDGTVLDHTLVLGIAEFGQGHAHSHKDLPIMVIGDAGGYFKQARWLRFPGQPQNDFLSTIADALGTPTMAFGDPRYCKGPMAGLRA